MNALVIFFLNLITFQCIFAQTIPKKELSEYLYNISDILSQRLKDYGISNLPDVDIKIHFNQSMYGYKLIGYLYLEDGFVMDIENMKFTLATTGPIISLEHISLRCALTFEKLTIFRDFRYEPTEPETIKDQTIGSVLITPDMYQVIVTINKTLTDNTINVEIKPPFQYQPGISLLNFYPKNGLTVRLRKAKPRPIVFDGLDTLWIPIFQHFIEDATSKIAFPKLVI